MGSVDARTFYDRYLGRQTEVAVIARHGALMQLLRSSGLPRHRRVPEIGYGVGSSTTEGSSSGSLRGDGPTASSPSTVGTVGNRASLVGLR
jgi:hypothetical protein